MSRLELRAADLAAAAAGTLIGLAIALTVAEATLRRKARR